MFQVHDGFTLVVKRNSKSIRSFLVLLGTISVLMSVFYCIYWGLALNGDIVIEYTKQYFSPLVGVFFEDVDSLDNYLTMGLYLFGMSIPFAIAHYLVQKTEEILIALHNKKTEATKRQERINAEIEREKEFTRIDSYSICVSLDFSNNKNLNMEFSEKLNNYIIKSLKKELNGIENNIEYYNKMAILIHAKNFYSYDKVYTSVLKVLANVKNLTGDSLSFVPTITTDAYIGEFNPEKAIRQHYEIVRCNLEGRATTTAMFTKKYNHLNQNKFAGVPIGLYTTPEKGGYKEYDLNVVHKNLNRTLTTMIK